jgi:hypothetical protein
MIPKADEVVDNWRPAQLPLSIFIVLIVAYTAIALNFDQPFVSYAFASAVVFLFVTHPRRRDWIGVAAAALGFSLCHIFFALEKSVPVISLSLYAGMLGRGALIVLAFRTVRAGRGEKPRLFKALLLSIGIVIFVLASLLALNFTIPARPRVLDAYLYFFDSSLGFQPSFLLGGFLAKCKPLADFAQTVYLGLPVAIALVCAGYLKRPSSWRPLAILASAGVLGYLLYWIFPAAGPIYIAGTNFPNSPRLFLGLGAAGPHPVTLNSRVPRNAIPSLHMAWALLLWFNCRPFSGTARSLALLYVVLTVMATLGTGEHYLIDLIVALPFAVAVQALWTPGHSIRLYAALAGAMSLTFLWLGALRYAAGFFMLSPFIPWVCVVGTILISLYLEWSISRTGGSRAALPEGLGKRCSA